LRQFLDVAIKKRQIIAFSSRTSFREKGVGKAACVRNIYFLGATLGKAACVRNIYFLGATLVCDSPWRRLLFSFLPSKMVFTTIAAAAPPANERTRGDRTEFIL
jgi:hypothetical protein